MLPDQTHSLFLLTVGLVTSLFLGLLCIQLGFRWDSSAPPRRLASWFQHRLDRSHRSRRDRAFRGWCVVLLMILGGGAVGLLVSFLSGTHRRGAILELLVLTLLLQPHDAFTRVRSVAKALQTSVAAARKAASEALTPAAADRDEHAIARIAIEEAALRFSHGVVAAAFWYVLFGLPALLAWLAVDGAYRAISDRPAFGQAARAAEAVLAYLPARIAGALLAVAAVGVPRARPERSVPAMMKSYPGLRSINAGWPLGAAAGALDLALAGPAGGEPWVGEGRARAGAADVNRMLLLYAIACALLLATLLSTGLALLAFAK